MNVHGWFLGLFIFCAMLASQSGQAAVSVAPVVPNYTAGFYSAPAGSFTMAAANSGFIQPAVANVGGKSITVPATLRMAANSGSYIKNAMRFNPWALVGTLAAGWLVQQAIEYVNDNWYAKPAFGPLGMVWVSTLLCGQESGNCTYTKAASEALRWCEIDASKERCTQTAAVKTSGTCALGSQCTVKLTIKYYDEGGGTVQWTTYEYLTSYGNVGASVAPLTDADWAALPDPTSVVAPELPYADYMPDGAPVEDPLYEFAPMSVPMGEAYTKPDGSTAQPMAKISPAGDMVTVDTYEQPLTDANGVPVPNAQPVDTADPVPDQCQKYPNSVGCASLDVPGQENLSSQTASIALIAPVAIGSAGQCPAPLTASVLGQSVEMSFDPLCQYANALRPLVLSLAWLAAGVIFIGGVRNG